MPSYDYKYLYNFMQRTQTSDASDEPYPINLIIDIRSWSNEQLNSSNNHIIVITPDMLPADINGTIEYLLARLSERDREIILKRYQEKRTYTDIAQDYDLTRERVRQIINKTLRKLSIGEGDKMLRYGIKEYFNQKYQKVIQIEKEQAEKTGYIKGWNAATTEYQTTKHIPQQLQTEKQNMSILHLDLSVRTYNALHFAGINTIQDLIELNGDQIKKIRNLGQKCWVEIYQTLADHGYDVSNKEVLLMS